MSGSKPISELTKDWSQDRLDAVEGRVEEIRAMLIAGEKSGISDRTPKDIMNAVLERKASKSKN